MRAWWVVVGLAACGDRGVPIAPADAGSMTYQLVAFAAEPAARPAPTVAPVTYIDGVAQQEIDLEYPSAAAATGTTHVVELRYGDVVVATKVVTVDPNGCRDATSGIVTAYEQGVCVLASGDLRDGDEQASGPNWGCTGDSFCMPDCFCTAAQHCTALVASMSPLASHLGCAPIGAAELGASCSFTADPGGAYDDCADGLVCVSSTCRHKCTVGGTDCATCSYVPGYPPELGVCM